jgi:threonine/homoserine/homoserine lactone efflux protein
MGCTKLAYAIKRRNKVRHQGFGVFEEIGVFYRGLVLGLMIAAPVGPICILCIRRTVQKGIAIGFATGFGAAIIDGLFAALAALGVAAIIDFMHHYDFIIRVTGGFVLLGVAWHTWHDQPRQPKAAVHIPGRSIEVPKPADAGLLSAFRALLSGLLITVTNPLTMFGTFAVVATFGHIQNGLDASSLVIGIFAGSTLWWVLLSGGIALLRGHFTEGGVVIMNRIIAVVLAVVAIWAVSSGAQGYFHHHSI